MLAAEPNAIAPQQQRRIRSEHERIRDRV